MKRIPVKGLGLGQLATGSLAGAPSIAMDALRDVEMQVSVVVGNRDMPIREFLELHAGSIVELDRLVGEPVDILVNHHRFARGEVVVIADSLGVRITEILAPEAVGGEHGKAVEGVASPIPGTTGTTPETA